MTEPIQLSRRQSWYSPDPGVVPIGQSVMCGVCGAICREERNLDGPRSWAMAMSGSKSLHDFFICEDYKERWHIQVEELMTLADRTPSPTLAYIYEKDIKEILLTKQPSKEFSRY